MSVESNNAPSPTASTEPPPPPSPGEVGHGTTDFYSMPADADAESKVFFEAMKLQREARELFRRITGVPFESLTGECSVLSRFLSATGLTAKEFCALPATHLEFLHRQMLREKDEETRTVGEFACETMGDGSVHVSGTFPPGKLEAFRSSVSYALAKLVSPEGMAMLAGLRDGIAGAVEPEPPKRKRRARKPPTVTPPATPAAPAQAPLDLGGAK